MIEQKEKDWLSLCNVVYLIILAAFIIHTYFDNTTFTIPWPNHYYEFLRIAMAGLVLVKLSLDKADDVKEVIKHFILWLILTISAYKTGYIFLIEISFLVMGAKNISFRRIAKLYFVISICILSITYVAALSGVIPNYVFYIGSIPKNSFGMLYSTDFAAHVFFTALVFVYLRGKKITYFECILIIISGFIIYSYTRARMNSGGLFALGILTGFVKIFESLSKKNDKIKRLSSMILCLMPLSFVILSVLSVLLTYFYNDKNVYFNKLNDLLSNRLILGKNGMSRYGYSLFGTAFDLIGTNFIQKEGYNFIDSSYVLVMLRYGILTLGLFIAIFTFVSFKAKKIKDNNLLIVLTLLAFQCCIEHHFLEINYNIFLLISFTTLEKNNTDGTIEYIINKKNILLKILLILTLCIVYTARNRIFSYLRTLVTILKLSDSDRQIYFIIFGIIILFIIISIYIILKTHIRYSRRILIVGIFFISIILYYINNILNTNYTSYKNDINNTISIIKSIDSDDYSIYVGDVPYYYQYKLKNVISGIPYAKNTNKNIVITSDHEEQTSLLKNGYVSARLNSLEYIYTNNEEAVAALYQSGLQFKKYYDYVNNVNLKKLAEYNNLTMKNGKLILSGSKKSLYRGPWEAVSSGKLKVICDLTLINNQSLDDNIAVLRATYENGSKEICNYKITKKDFYNNNKCLLEIEGKVKDISDFEIKIDVKDGVTLEVNSIKYFKEG